MYQRNCYGGYPMYISIVINHFIFNLSNFTRSLEIFLPLLFIILITGFFLNKILKILYYFFIEIRSSKQMELKEVTITNKYCNHSMNKHCNHRMNKSETKKSADTK